MRVLLGAFGSRGDVQPMVALGQALVRRGHGVRLAVSPSSLALARAHGLDAFGVGLDYEEVLRRAAVGTFRELVGLMPLVRDQVPVQLEAMEAEVERADVIAGSTVCTVGSILGEAHKKPSAFIVFAPQMFRSAAYPSPAFRLQGMPQWVNRLTWSINAAGWNLLLKRTFNEARAKRGLALIGDAWTSLVGEAPMAACDEALAPAPTDHHVPVKQVGALWLEDPAELSAEVRDFLAAGEPPVYMGFGSMADPAPARTAARLVEAARRAGARALISRGWAGLEAEAPEKDVLFIGAEPHEKLFPRCAAVVHHGGSGTTHAAARAGVPQVVMPQVLDQFFWAARVERLGLGPGRVARHGSSPAPLATALERCLKDEGLKATAKAFAGRVGSDGCARAVTALEELAARGPR